MVVNLVHAQGQEVGEHDFDDGTPPGQGQANGGAGDAGLADGGGDDPSLEFLGQPGGDLEGAAVGFVQVFTDHQAAGIAGQQVAQGVVERLAHGFRLGAQLGCGRRCGGAQAMGGEVGEGGFG